MLQLAGFAPSPQPQGMRVTRSLGQISTPPPVQISLRVAGSKGRSCSAEKPVPPEPQPVATCSKRSELCLPSLCSTLGTANLSARAGRCTACGAHSLLSGCTQALKYNEFLPSYLYFSLHPCLVPGAVKNCVLLHSTKGLQSPPETGG